MVTQPRRWSGPTVLLVTLALSLAALPAAAHADSGLPPPEAYAVHAGGPPEPRAARAAVTPSDGVGEAPATTASASDAWSAVGTFRTAEGWYAAPIHAALLPDGRVHFIGIARDASPATPLSRARRVSWVFTPPPAGTEPAREVIIDELSEPVEHTSTVLNGVGVYDDLYCTSATLDDTGRVITAGGTRVVFDHTSGAVSYTLGLPYQTVYDGTTWVRLPGEMVGRGHLGSPARWYPTVTRLPDRRMLVTGGLELITTASTGTANRSVETLDPHTGERALVSSHANTPEAIHARDYTSVFVLPYAGSGSDLLMVADAGVPVRTSATPGSPWTPLARRPDHGTTPQPGWGATSVMLPIRLGEGTDAPYRNGSILVAGGDMVGSYQRSADVLDPVSGQWRPTIDLGINRHHPNAVALADGRVLITAGHDMSGATDVTRAQYIDPSAGFSVATGTSSSGVIRGYHSVTLLLPDGRVLVAGGRDVVTSDSLEKPTYQIYTPDYLQRPRPVIASAPDQLDYEALFALPTVGTPLEVVLVGLGSQTHSFDTGQRVIQLPIGATFVRDDGAALSIVGAPPDAHVAPPGFYGLVVIDSARTPSVARILHIG